MWRGAEPCCSEARLCEWDGTGITEAQSRTALQLIVQPLPQGRVYSKQDPQTLHLQTAMTTPPCLCLTPLPFSLCIGEQGVFACLLFDLHKFIIRYGVYENKIWCLFVDVIKMLGCASFSCSKTQFKRGKAIHVHASV